MWLRCVCSLAFLSVAFQLADAGLHYSAERIADLPSQWRGYLTDLRILRNIAVKPTAMQPISPMRQQYEDAVKKLRETAKSRSLSPDEQADLGALLIRLGEVHEALDVLRSANRNHPQHYAIAANLGTAWQLAGDLRQAEEHLRHAVRLSPGKLQRAEELHLRLVQLRQRQSKEAQELDDLFGVRYVGERGQFVAGGLAAGEMKKLPSDAIAQVQQLALWLPNDARLLWQLGELANAYGDAKTAGDIFESCVGQFALSSRMLREHRSAVREALAEQAKRPTLNADAARTEHAVHIDRFAPKSRRPLLVKQFDSVNLPPISKEGVNVVPWALFMESSVDRQFRPTFPKYLQELNGRQVSIAGFMQPLTDEVEMSSFMLIEYPTGCWYCEMPEMTGIVLVELPEGKTVRYSRSIVKITGKFRLNATDPEDFLFTIKGAAVAEPD